MEKQQHLTEMFRRGKPVTLKYVDPDTSQPGEVELWLSKPSSQQQDQALKVSKAKQVRRQVEFANQDEAEYLAIWQAVDRMSREEVVNALADFHEGELRTQSFNEVLHSEEHGSDWSDEGDSYLGLLEAITQRLQEIAAINDDETSERVNPEDDEELQRLSVRQEKFQEEVDERFEVLRKGVLVQHKNKRAETVKDELIEKRIEQEVGMVWYQEYRTQMLYYSVRYPDSHDKLYFDSPYDVLELPLPMQMQLFREVDDLDQGIESAKNLLTPLLS